MNHIIAILLVTFAFILLTPIGKDRLNTVLVLTVVFTMGAIVYCLVAITKFIELFKRRPKHEAVRRCRKEYEQIRSSIHLCIASGPLLLIDMRIENFKAYSENILPAELHFNYCSSLEKLFAEKEKEIIELEFMLDGMTMSVNA